MLNPDDNAAEILKRHDKRIEALEIVLTGLARILLLYTGVKSILKALEGVKK